MSQTENSSDPYFRSEGKVRLFFVRFVYLLQSTFLSLPWEIAHAYLQNPKSMSVLAEK